MENDFDKGETANSHNNTNSSHIDTAEYSTYSSPNCVIVL